MANFEMTTFSNGFTKIKALKILDIRDLSRSEQRYQFCGLIVNIGMTFYEFLKDFFIESCSLEEVRKNSKIDSCKRNSKKIIFSIWKPFDVRENYSNICEHKIVIGKFLN